MAIDLCNDHKGNDISLAETRWKPNHLTLVIAVRRKKTVDFQLLGSMDVVQITKIRDQLTAWIESKNADRPDLGPSVSGEE